MTAAAACSIANASLFCEARALMKKLEDDLVAPDAMHMTHDQMCAHTTGRCERVS